MYCEDEDEMELSCESVEICCTRAPFGSTGCSNVSREPVDVVPIVNQSIAAVPGNIVFTGVFDNETHVYSVDRSTAEIYQLSINDAQYRAVSVGPDRRFSFIPSSTQPINRQSGFTIYKDEPQKRSVPRDVTLVEMASGGLTTRSLVLL